MTPLFSPAGRQGLCNPLNGIRSRRICRVLPEGHVWRGQRAGLCISGIIRHRPALLRQPGAAGQGGSRGGGGSRVAQRR